MSNNGTATILDMQAYRLMMMVKNPKSASETRRAQREAAAVAAVPPAVVIESMMAAQAAAAHKAAMDTFRRAAQPGVTNDVLVKLLATAEALSRHSERSMKVLQRRRAANPSRTDDTDPGI